MSVPCNAASNGDNVIYVAPGQLAVASEPSVLKTILGSCVAVCLYDPYLHIGGMNHFLLPTPCGAQDGSFRHGDAALAALLERMTALGSSTRDLCAGVCGGARVLGQLSDMTHLGERNFECARDWLAANHIALVFQDVLGQRARRVEFRLSDGATRVQLLGAA